MLLVVVAVEIVLEASVIIPCFPYAVCTCTLSYVPNGGVSDDAPRRCIGLFSPLILSASVVVLYQFVVSIVRVSIIYR